MAYERDNDRLASELLGKLLGSLNKPVAGTGQTVSKPQVDENNMLNTIKEFLNQSVPGTKPREQPGAPTAAQPGAIASQTWGVDQSTPSGGWEAIFRRQGEEREAMFARQDQERQDMEKRHLKEMEMAIGAAPTSSRPAGPYIRRAERPARQWGQPGGSGLV